MDTLVTLSVLFVLVVGNGALNLARGRKVFGSKTVVYALMGILGEIAFLVQENWLEPDFIRAGAFGLLLSFGLWGCFSVGWGKFFPNGWNYVTEKDERTGLEIRKALFEEEEFRPAEWLANFVVGKWDREMPVKFVKRWQTVAMCGRFLFTFGFLFPLLALATGDPLTALCGLPMGLAGLLYRVCFIKFTEKSVARSEILVGALLGLCVYLSIP